MIRYSKVRFAVAILLAAALPVRADDIHLEPEYSILGASWPNAELHDYQLMLVSVFHKAYEPNVRTRVVLISDAVDSPESAVGIRKEGDSYEIFDIIAGKRVAWYQEIKWLEECEADAAKDPKTKCDRERLEQLRRELPGDYHDIPVEECKRAIDVRIGERVVALWDEMVYRTRYYDERKECDAKNTICINSGHRGVEYHFYSRVQPVQIAGQTYSPDKATELGALVSIAYQLKAVCHSDEAHELSELQAQVAAFEKRVDKDR